MFPLFGVCVLKSQIAIEPFFNLNTASHFPPNPNLHAKGDSICNISLTFFFYLFIYS